ncbi:SRPBCC family protein [Lunatibacter salilacus]|uniref:SRPBCC family protein n=1 Tax=Lunatibacter salilacus TaxID=2483804 RepID=UPI00131B5060|nr:SRPBCC family protein [Lunatibacter salilacus]
MIKIIVLGIAGLIILLLFVALMMKKEYTISAETVIDRPRSEVFEFVSHLKNQEYYSKWVMADPNVKMDYRGVDGTVGFVAAWESEQKNVGVGEQEITKIMDGEGYEVEIRFEKPFKGVNQAITRIDSVGANQSKVTNTFHTRTPFPMNLMIPFIKSMLKKDMAQNMNNLKQVLEN